MSNPPGRDGTPQNQSNDDVLEVKERLDWVEATMEEAIKGLETLSVNFHRHQQLSISWLCTSFLPIRWPPKMKFQSAKDVGNSGKPEVWDGDGGRGRCGKVILKYAHIWLLLSTHATITINRMVPFESSQVTKYIITTPNMNNWINVLWTFWYAANNQSRDSKYFR